ncbi:tripartite tricarboxylate transporter substrate binding protein [Ramlibacter sp. AW1]|uniref:Tripartite tricarboxylate transporter substrate binding protein n=1 Tax=Ramlibacter aurantiacus TaxID=2801330 RepID=A0A936ZJ96_9BURK|nr:tripartite tricarboxylate transporter substrate binding protein [Ramlibacter aurantiacus]MBL0421932.1 tripartite tricarboxylate transporter substrate binding protein [Ramlibacter aurantiacus]
MTASRRRLVAAGIATLALAGFTTTSWAQQPAAWPTKPVKIILPAAAGTAPDIMARILGDKLGKVWGQSVVVENKPGAGGVIGMVTARGAERDGHTLVLAPASVLTMTQYMYRPTQVDIPKDFTAVSLVAVGPMMMAVAANSPINTLADLVAAARKDPDKYVAATTFQYSVPHLTADMLAKATDMPLRSVPFASSAQSISAVVNGDAQVVIDGIPPLEAMVKGGRLKAIAVFSESRIPNRPQLPAVAEAYPSMVVNGWFGVVAPNGTPPSVVDKVHRDLASVLAQPDVVERLDGFGVYPRPMSSAQFATFWNQERQRWEKALKDVGAQPVQQ